MVGDIKQRLEQIIFELCTEHNWRLIALEIMPNHVHLFLEVDPTFAPSVIIKRIKGRASHHLRKEFPRLLKLPFGLLAFSVLQQEMLQRRLLGSTLKTKPESNTGLKPARRYSTRG